MKHSLLTSADRAVSRPGGRDESGPATSRLSVAMVLRAGLAALTSLVALSPAAAQDRPFCADRPGLGTPPCTLAPGEAMIEVGLAGIERDSDRATITRTLTALDTVLRWGVSERAEVQAGLTGLVAIRTRDRASGAVARDRAVGDGMLAVRRGLAGANGPLAVQAFVALPIGRGEAGAGDWGAGVLLPLSVALPGEWELGLTPRIEAAVDADRHGRHLAYGVVAGLARDIGSDVSAALEVGAWKDRDPAGHAFDARLAGSLAWRLDQRWQVDLQIDAGLSVAAPDRAFLIGLAHRLR